jgi:hypothetical protein
MGNKDIDQLRRDIYFWAAAAGYSPELTQALEAFERAIRAQYEEKPIWPKGVEL